jgi:hypothetical protein
MAVGAGTETGMGMEMATDEIVIEAHGAAGDVPLNPITRDGRPGSRSEPRPGLESKHVPVIIMENHEELRERAGENAEVLEAVALEDRHGRELPWPTLAKWRKSVVLLGCVHLYLTWLEKLRTPVSNSFIPSRLFLGLFLSTLDTSIVATALVTILTDFNDFALSPWVVLAYLLTYMGMRELSIGDLDIEADWN